MHRHFSFPTQRLARLIAHKGAGEARTARLPERDGNGFRFVKHTQIPPGSCIGAYARSSQHAETYVIISGRGLVQLEDGDLEVIAGDVINVKGGAQGVENTGTEPLRMVMLDTDSPARAHAMDDTDFT